MRGVKEIKLFFPFRILPAQVFFPKPITTFSFIAARPPVTDIPRECIYVRYFLLTVNV